MALYNTKRNGVGDNTQPIPTRILNILNVI